MGLEGPRKDSAPAPDLETSEVPRGVTRREFLKGLGAAVLYPGALLAEEKSGAQKEIERSAAERARVYEKGLIELRLEARMNPKEQQRLFIDNGAQSKWIPLEEGGQTSAWIPFEPIKESLSDKRATVMDFHTHPSGTIPSGFTMPPSLQDVMSLPEIKKSFKDDMDRLSFATIDEQGSWTYDLDWKNPVLVEALESKRITEEKFASIQAGPEIKAFFASQTDEDVRLAAMNLIAREQEFSPEARVTIDLLKEVSSRATELVFFKEALRLENQGCIPAMPEKIHERIEALRKIGIIVSFTPF